MKEATWRCTHGWLRGEQCELCKETMTKDDALKLALEALEVYWGKAEHRRTKEDESKAVEAITAIKEALAQPEQEPVAWEQFYPDIGKPQLKQELVAIYRAGQAKGERFHVEFLKEMGDDEVLLYTTPPKRPWVGLTNEEIKVIHFDLCNTVGSDYKTVARAVEAKLKEKNT